MYKSLIRIMSYPSLSFFSPLSQVVWMSLHRGHLSHPLQSPRQSLQMLLSHCTSVPSVKGPAMLGPKGVTVGGELTSASVTEMDA